MSIDLLAEARKNAAHYAVDNFIKSNSVIGLGTGRTAQVAIIRIAEKLKSGELENIIGIPTSESTKKLAETINIPISTLEQHNSIDVAIDGADEICLQTFQLVKGRGGALLREKLVEECAKQFVVMVDETKIVKKLGETGAIPVEVNRFGISEITNKLKNCKFLKNVHTQIRMLESSPFLTDNDNYIVDIFLDEQYTIQNAIQIANEIKQITGVVEHGFFIGMATNCVIAKADGTIESFKAPN